MAGSTHGYHHGRNFPGNPQFVAGFHLQRDGGGGGTGAQGGQGRSQDDLEEVLDPPAAGANVGVQPQEQEEVQNDHGVEHQHGIAVGFQKVNAVGPGQVRKVGAQTNGSGFHENGHHLVAYQGHGVHPFYYGFGRFTNHGYADAEENGQDDQGQYVEPRNQQRQVAHRQGIDNLVTDGHRLHGRLGGFGGVKGGGHPGKVGDNQDQCTGNDGGGNENQQGVANHFPYLARILGVGNRAGNGEENQGYNQTKQ